MYDLDQFSMILAETLLKHNFQFPLTWTLIGVNGHVFAGRFEVSITPENPKTVIVCGKPEELRFPINVLLVDKSGKGVHIFYESPKRPAEANTFEVGHT